MDDTNDAVAGEIVGGERPVIVLKNGVMKDPTTNKFISGPTNPPINASNASAMAKRRHELTRQKLAQQLAAVSKETGRIVTGPADAVADAGGILWRDTVLNDKAPARERRETWLALGKHAGLLADQRESADSTAPAPVSDAQKVMSDAIYSALVRLRDEMSGNNG